MYSRIFKGIDGNSASQKDRGQFNIEDPSFTFGEIDYFSFQDTLRAAGFGAADGKIFYDLGCGSGRCVILCECYHEMCSTTHEHRG